MDLIPNEEFSINSFKKIGYFIAKAEIEDNLLELQSFLAKSIRKYYAPIKEESHLNILNQFHSNYCSTESKLNEVRMDLMKELDSKNNIYSLSSIVYKSFSRTITSLIGPDILAQKSANLVIQPPESKFFSELHTDAPGNSEFELVAWVPMVNCYSGKSFYVIDRTNSLKLLSSYRKGEFSSWKDFRESSLVYAKEVNVPFGYALFFWSGLLHGSHINSSKETRWSFNTRYKNTFAPCGKKDPFQYFSPLKISDLTSLGLDSIEI